MNSIALAETELSILVGTIKRLLDPISELGDTERELIERLADDLLRYEHHDLARIAALAMQRSTLLRAALLAVLSGSETTVTAMRDVANLGAQRIDLLKEMTKLLSVELTDRAAASTRQSKAAINKRHDMPGGSRDKQQQVRDAWASGKYKSRDQCANTESEVLKMSFSAARKALRKTPDPG